MKAFLLCLSSIFLFNTSFASADLFSSLHGYWKGNRGKLMAGGPAETVACRAWVKSQNQEIYYKFTCKTPDSFKVSVKMQLTEKAGKKIVGSWTDSYVQTKGRAVGVVKDDGIQLKLIDTATNKHIGNVRVVHIMKKRKQAIVATMGKANFKISLTKSGK